jgi:hypothetical protein
MAATDDRPYGGNAKLLDPKEAAAWLNVSVSTLAHWRRVGTGPPWVKLDNGKIRYSAAGVSGHLYDRETQAVRYTSDAAIGRTLKKLKRMAMKEAEREALRLGLQAVGIDVDGEIAKVKESQRKERRSLNYLSGWCSRCHRPIRTWKAEHGGVCCLCVRELQKTANEKRRKGYDVDPPPDPRETLLWKVDNFDGRS